MYYSSDPVNDVELDMYAYLCEVFSINKYGVRLSLVNYDIKTVPHTSELWDRLQELYEKDNNITKTKSIGDRNHVEDQYFIDDNPDGISDSQRFIIQEAMNVLDSEDYESLKYLCRETIPFEKMDAVEDDHMPMTSYINKDNRIFDVEEEELGETSLPPIDELEGRENKKY